MDIKRSGSQPSDKALAEHFTGNERIDPLFEVPDLARAQHLPPYIERPSDAAGVFAIYPGRNVPPDSEKWTWHEQTMQVSMSGSTALTAMVRQHLPSDQWTKLFKYWLADLGYLSPGP